MPQVAGEIRSAAFLFNGRYHVLIESDGGGHSAYEGHLLTPELGMGTCLYVEDVEAGRIWTAGSKAVPAESASYRFGSGPGAYRMRRTEEPVRVTTDVCVVPNRDAELRRYTVSNRSDQSRVVRLTWMTVVESGGVPVVTERVDDGVMAVRRVPKGGEIYWLHGLVRPRGALRAVETNGSSFFGPEWSHERPPGLEEGLSDETGSGEDAVLGLQTEAEIEPNAEQTFTLACSAARSRRAVESAVTALANPQVVDDAFLEAALNEQRARDGLKLDPKTAARFHAVAAAMLRGSLRGEHLDLSTEDEIIAEAAARLGLDPERLLVVCRVSDESELDVAKTALKAKAFWSTLGLPVQLLILNAMEGPGANALQQKLHESVELDDASERDILLRHADVVTPADQKAVQAAAQLILTRDRVGLLRGDVDIPSG
ncbi:MAG: hypothetical protein WD423_11835 [Rhodothermales bacterium]